MSDEKLIAECKKGNPQSQRMLYTQYASKMMSVCYRYVNNKEIAQDILQDAFVKVFTKLDTYTGKGSFAGWVRRIFVTTSLEYLRKNDLMRFSTSIDEHSNIEDEDNVSAMSKLTADELLKCIANLPSGYRTVFNLYAIEGYSHSEIASLLNIKEKTSQSQLLRARKILQKDVEAILGHEYIR